jgi:hypothetical protein
VAAVELRIVKPFPDNGYDLICAVEDVVVEKAQHAEPSVPQPVITFLVVRVEVVEVSVGFHDQPLGHTNEVDDERPDWFLPPKPNTESATSQLLPQDDLGQRHVVPHIAGAVEVGAGSIAMSHAATVRHCVI